MNQMMPTIINALFSSLDHILFLTLAYLLIMPIKDEIFPRSCMIVR
jgi:hypothetical protein